MSTPKTQPKLFYKIDEVSRLTKLDLETIESWEKEFPFLQPGLTGSGQKIFRPKDVEIIQRIKVSSSRKTSRWPGLNARSKRNSDSNRPRTSIRTALRRSSGRSGTSFKRSPSRWRNAQKKRKNFFDFLV